MKIYIYTVLENIVTNIANEGSVTRFLQLYLWFEIQFNCNSIQINIGLL